MPDEVLYDSRAAGCGKTFEQIRRIVANPDLYLFVVDRVDLMDERRAALEQQAAAAGARLFVKTIYSSRARPVGGVASVRVAVEALPQTYRAGHICVLVTHQAVKEANLDGFEDWHVIIDEAPSWWDRCKLRTSASAMMLPELFDLVPGEAASRIVPRKGLTRRELHLDSLAAPLASLYARASHPESQVLTHLESWSELAEKPEWTWWGLTSPKHLSPFQSATVLAAGFERSLTYHLAQKLAPEIRWRQHVAGLSDARPYLERTLKLRYFAADHAASRYWFNSASGKGALAQIAGHISRQPGPRIWSCNEPERAIFAPRLGHGFLLPKQAGTNSFAHVDQAALMYTAKPDLQERRVLTAMGIDLGAVVETREHDVLYQFVARTSLRDPASARPVTAWVYDRVQAEAVARSFAAQPAINVELELVDLGFGHIRPERNSLANMNPEERTEYIRRQNRERQRRRRIKSCLLTK